MTVAKQQSKIEEKKYISIPVSRLHLDLSNYRHEKVNSEAEAIALLCNQEYVSGLASDIATRGELSPLDVLGVVPMEGNPGHYVAVEGNRRTCALIILNDPSRAPEKFRSRIQSIAGKAKIPRTVRAYLFDSKAEAKEWIDLRHLGLQGGAGTKEWSSEQKNRALGDNTKSSARENTLSVAVLDRLFTLGLISEDQRRAASVTTLTRYLGTPGVRAILGIGSSKELLYTHDEAEVDAALTRLVLDSIQPRSDGTYRVNSRSNSKQRLQYANELKAEGVAPTTHLASPMRPTTSGKSSAQKAASPAAQKRSAAHPDNRNKLIPTNFKISIDDNVLLRLRREGADLELETFRFSANYILRALVEQVMTLFVRKHGKWSKSMSDQALQQACAERLSAIGVQGKALTVVSKAGGSTDTPHGLHSLGHVVHGGAIPTSTDLKAYFDTWRPALEAMLADLEAKPKTR